MKKAKLIYTVGDLREYLNRFKDDDCFLFTINGKYQGEDVEMYVSEATCTTDETDKMCHMEINYNNRVEDEESEQ